MTEEELAAWDKANPKKTFHKRWRYNKYGGVSTFGDLAKDFGLQTKEEAR